MAEAVVVGVRVRPFNDREKGLNAKLCIDMQGTATIITDMQSGTPTTFNFDQSYWSHDEFEDDGTGYMRPIPGGRYADQRYVFETFGQRVLDNAWAGYHCCLFAYGQTGAGKSYSMVGYGNNKGIVPISCEEIFNRIGSNSDPNKRYEVMLSMVEIYNETVQDLFIPFDARPKAGYQIRESKALGVYVDGVIKAAVDSYTAIEKEIEHGTSNRSVGSTAMNATSSRAHTVITIEFKQVDIMDGKESVKLSMINLVDLAGSEKAGQTGAKGDRLKEGSAINKSLSALGNVIEKLAEKSSNPKKAKDIVVPYRDSKLTRLLQNALGGSSKTIMICALSPASSNYEETLSTLRYADRAKKIKNNVVVNENPQEKLMREMREENAKLKAMLESAGLGGGGGGGGDTEAQSEALEKQREQIAELERALQEQMRSFQDKVAETRSREETFYHSSKRSTHNIKKNMAVNSPMMVNLNAELQLSGKLRYEFMIDHTALIGGPGVADEEEEENSDAESDEEPEIQLGCDGVYNKHAKVQNVDGRCFLLCDGAPARATWVNGVSVADLHAAAWDRDGDAWVQRAADAPDQGRGEGYQEGDPAGILLRHGDRLVFGKGIFLFVDPKEGIAEVLIMAGQYTYAKARKELPETWRGAAAGKSLKSKLQKAIKSQVVLNTLFRPKGGAAGGLLAAAKAAAAAAAAEGAADGGAASAPKRVSFKAEDSDDSGFEEAHADAPSAQLKKQLEAKDRELAELRAQLEAKDRAAKEVEAKQAQAEREKDVALAAKVQAELQEKKAKADLSHLRAETQAKDRAAADARAHLDAALHAQAVAERERRLAARAAEQALAKARLDDALARLRGAAAVAGAAGVDGAMVTGAEKKLELLDKNTAVTDKLFRLLTASTKEGAIDLRIAIQQAMSVHGLPIDRGLVRAAEERLEKLTATA